VTALQSPASTSATSKKSQFNADLCQAFVSANIPIWKLTNSTLRNFLEKYTTETIPAESTIRKNYVGDCYEEMMKRIRQDLDNELIWVSIDETTDSAGRYVATVVVGRARGGTYVPVTYRYIRTEIGTVRSFRTDIATSPESGYRFLSHAKAYSARPGHRIVA
jgi:hypothetical protein